MMRSVSPRLISAAACIGAAGIVVTILRPELVAGEFLPPDVEPHFAWSFVPPDFLAYVAFPALGAAGLWNGRPWTGRALWIGVGATLYSLLWVTGAQLVFEIGLFAQLLAIAPALLMIFAGLRWRLHAQPDAGEGDA